MTEESIKKAIALLEREYAKFTPGEQLKNPIARQIRERIENLSKLIAVKK